MAPTGGGLTLTTATAEETRELGRRLAGLLRAGDLVVLSGELGAGKTTLTQGIGEGLGVRGVVSSPTFVLSRVHPSLGNGPLLVHADAYRLSGQAELDDLDLDETTDGAVTVVEWGKGMAEHLAESHLQVRLEAADEAEDSGDDSPRRISLSAAGPRWTDVPLLELLSASGASDST